MRSHPKKMTSLGVTPHMDIWQLVSNKPKKFQNWYLGKKGKYISKNDFVSVDIITVQCSHFTCMTGNAGLSSWLLASPFWTPRYLLAALPHRQASGLGWTCHSRASCRLCPSKSGSTMPPCQTASGKGFHWDILKLLDKLMASLGFSILLIGSIKLVHSCRVFQMFSPCPHTWFSDH